MLSEAGIPSPLFESELILAHLLNTQRHNLYIEKFSISPRLEKEFFYLVSKRANRIPLAYLLKNTYFYGYRFYITRGVFIPRPETETIVKTAIELSKDTNQRLNILDICTGCGALAIVLAKTFPYSRVIATDISKRAVMVAKKNVTLHNLASRVSVFHSDIIPENITDKFSLIVSNPPYLTKQEILQADEEVKKEPVLSLYGGKDGMEIISRILKIIPEILSKNGHIIFEISPDQVEHFKKLEDKNFNLFSVCKDMSGTERVVILKKI